MKLGFGLPIAGEWATPENQLRVARHAEALGYHSLWAFQRLLYPLAPKNEYYGAPGPAWPKPFERAADPIVSLAWVAGATRSIRLGTSVLIMPFYQPSVLAKQLATLDIVSGGRLDVASLSIVCRGSFQLHETAQGRGRRALWGTLPEIRDDIRRYADLGVTELFLEANFQPGGAALERVLPVMEALGPNR